MVHSKAMRALLIDIIIYFLLLSLEIDFAILISLMIVVDNR